MSIVFIAAACALLIGVVAWWMLKGPTHSRIRITVDRSRVLEVSGGDTLMNTLAREGIRLRSTCGGRGACAMCKCRIVKGGGRIAQRELPFFNSKEVEGKWRLACQVKVHGDMAVQLPENVEFDDPAVATS
ncbi:MAG: 2Fe-2S iron-sulfur cluster binding domain-containing protein [Flavobacteriales bacterium]|nr:2Fe-2S iron-sulfur cluster binding domain-containing protein [Flavobacteriales bacterium]